MTDTNEQITARIAVNLRELREQAGLSQRALGRAAGVSGTAVRGWELGDGQITAVHLACIARALEVSVARILGDDGSTSFQDGYETGWAACLAHILAALDEAAAPRRDGA